VPYLLPAEAGRGSLYGLVWPLWRCQAASRAGLLAVEGKLLLEDWHRIPAHQHSSGEVVKVNRCNYLCNLDFNLKIE
jgi:hypothetical protein